MKWLLLLCLAGNAYGWQQSPPLPIEYCQSQSPYGFPNTIGSYVQSCRHAYAHSLDLASKLAIWTSYTLTPQNALGCIQRSNSFTADDSLPIGYRSELRDYAKSGYDMGHIAPNGDMSFDQQAELESFLLSNMMPQLPSLNRGAWKLLETAIRAWSVQYNHSFTIYAGPIFNQQDTTIGQSKVVVPHAFYKIVINNATGEVAGFLFYQSFVGHDLTRARTTINNIQQLTGIQFKYPSNASELDLNRLWPIDTTLLTQLKKQVCRR